MSVKLTTRVDDTRATVNGYGIGSRIAGLVLWIGGGLAAFLGLFLLLGPEEEYLGLGGDLSWRVGDVHLAGGYGLAAAGLAALVGALVMTLRMRAAPKIETTAREVLTTHAVVFAVVNLFVWLQDIALGDGVNEAYWVTITWGLGLLAHATAYFSERRRL